MSKATPEEIERLLRAGGVISTANANVVTNVPRQFPGGAPVGGGPGPGAGVAAGGGTESPPDFAANLAASDGGERSPSDSSDVKATENASKSVHLSPEQAAQRIADRIRAGGKIGFDQGFPITLDFRTPAEMMLYFDEELTPHEWQLEETHRLGGYLNLEDPERFEPARPTKEAPLMYQLVAANGSGKDTYVISPFALWFTASKIRSRVIVTSATQDQLKLQTFKYISDYAKRVNARLGFEVYHVKEFYVYNVLTGSEIVGRVTNDPGHVEGFHPFPSPPNCEMAVVVNEAKTITDEIQESFVRFTGYNYWLEISSPGRTEGQFYKNCMLAGEGLCELAKAWVRYVTAFECPNITKSHIDTVALRHGKESYIYVTSILARFFNSAFDVVIPESLLKYTPPAPNDYGLHTVAGLDIAFSSAGDYTRFSCWRGNRELYKSEVQTESSERLHNWIVEQLNHCKAMYKLEPEHCYADGGGLGKPIISRVIEAGYQITTRRNEAQAYDTSYYANRGAEMYFHVKRLFELKILVQPTDDLARKQITSRKAILAEGKQKYALEPKAKAKGRLGYSPDRADSIVLALSGYTVDAFINHKPAMAHNRLIDTLTDPAQRARLLTNFAFDYKQPPQRNNENGTHRTFARFYV